MTNRDESVMQEPHELQYSVVDSSLCLVYATAEGRNTWDNKIGGLANPHGKLVIADHLA